MAEERRHSPDGRAWQRVAEGLDLLVHPTWGLLFDWKRISATDGDAVEDYAVLKEYAAAASKEAAEQSGEATELAEVQERIDAANRRIVQSSKSSNMANTELQELARRSKNINSADQGAWERHKSDVHKWEGKRGEALDGKVAAENEKKPWAAKKAESWSWTHWKSGGDPDLEMLSVLSRTVFMIRNWTSHRSDKGGGASIHIPLKRRHARFCLDTIYRLVRCILRLLDRHPRVALKQDGSGSDNCVKVARKALEMEEAAARFEMDGCRLQLPVLLCAPLIVLSHYPEGLCVALTSCRILAWRAEFWNSCSTSARMTCASWERPQRRWTMTCCTSARGMMTRASLKSERSTAGSA